MNTKKFIKEVNKLGIYYCIIDEDDRNCFFINEGFDSVIRIDTGIKGISTSDNNYFFAGFIDEDVELLNLLSKYAKLAEWDKPKKKWFE